MSAESGFIRIHWDKGAEPAWFSAARVERGEPAAAVLPPVQHDVKRPVAAAGAPQTSCNNCKCKSKKCCDELDTPSVFNLAALKRRSGFLLTVAALVLFILACSSQEWVTQQQRFFSLTDSTGAHHVNVAANVRRGPWAFCIDVLDASSPDLLADSRNLGPRCVSIDNDCEAEFDFFLGATTVTFAVDIVADDNRDSCDGLRAVRATALLAIIFAFFAAVYQYKNAPSGIWLGVVSGVFGMIAMAIMRDQFGELAFGDYGAGFWLVVIAWPLVFLASFLFWFFQDENRKGDHLLTLLAILVFVFYTVAITTNSVVYTYESTSTTVLNANTTRDLWYNSLEHTTYTSGFWKYCVKVEEPFGGISEVCYDINNSCELENEGRPLHGQMYSYCDKVRTMRAFLIIAVVLSAAAFLLMIANYVTGKWFWFNFLVISAVELSAFITVAVSVDFYQSPVTVYGYSFWVLIVGFAATFLVHLMFVATNKDVAVNYRNWVAACAGLAAFVAICTAISMTSWVVLHDKPLFNDAWTQSNYPARYGLWRICRGLNDNESCIGIETDTYCVVNDGDEANFNDCHRFNAVRAFALLTAISAFFYFVKSASAACQEDGKRFTCKSTRVLGYVTAIFGATATALAVSYYDLEAKEYGFSFWLFLVSWVVVALTTFNQCSAYKKNAGSHLAATLTFVAFLFFVIAASKPAIVRHDVANPGAPTTDRLSISTGWYYQCYKTAVDVTDVAFQRDPLQKCRFIKTSCKTSESGVAMDDCDKFNGIRATGTIALLLAGLSWLAQCSYNRGNDAPGNKGIAFFFPYLSAIFGLISMALTLSYYEHHPVSEFGYPFWLAVLGWVFVGVAGFIFCASNNCEKPKETGAAESGVEMASRQ